MWCGTLAAGELAWLDWAYAGIAKPERSVKATRIERIRDDFAFENSVIFSPP